MCKERATDGQRDVGCHATSITRTGSSTQASPPTRNTCEARHVAVRKLNQRDLRVVLSVDRFECLRGNPQLDISFYNVLRSIAGRYQLVFLTTSVRPLIEFTYSSHPGDIVSSPFFNIFAVCRLRSRVEDGPYV